MTKTKRVLVLVHPQFSPDRGKMRLGTERDVWLALRRLGHSVRVVGLRDNLREFDCELKEFRPQIVFNLLEEFQDEAVFDFHLVSYLESLGLPFTGCNPRGLILSRNKFVVGEFAGGLGVRVPRSVLLRPIDRLPSETPPFPLFVKLNREHASLGIRESNRVSNRKQLGEVCTRLRRDFDSEILLQEFIPGRDVSVAIWGNSRPEVLDPRTIQIRGRARVSTARLKWSAAFQRRHGVKTVAYRGPSVQVIQRQASQLYRHLDMNGYARFDFRVNDDQVPYLIDVNANPNLEKVEDFAASLRARGWTYVEVIDKILQFGLNYRPNR